MSLTATYRQDRLFILEKDPRYGEFSPAGDASEWEPRVEIRQVNGAIASSRLGYLGWAKELTLECEVVETGITDYSRVLERVADLIADIPNLRELDAGAYAHECNLMLDTYGKHGLVLVLLCNLVPRRRDRVIEGYFGSEPSRGVGAAVLEGSNVILLAQSCGNDSFRFISDEDREISPDLAYAAVPQNSYGYPDRAGSADHVDFIEAEDGSVGVIVSSHNAKAHFFAWFDDADIWHIELNGRFHTPPKNFGASSKSTDFGHELWSLQVDLKQGLSEEQAQSLIDVGNSIKTLSYKIDLSED